MVTAAAVDRAASHMEDSMEIQTFDPLDAAESAKMLILWEPFEQYLEEIGARGAHALKAPKIRSSSIGGFKVVLTVTYVESAFWLSIHLESAKPVGGQTLAYFKFDIASSIPSSNAHFKGKYTFSPGSPTVACNTFLRVEHVPVHQETGDFELRVSVRNTTLSVRRKSSLAQSSPYLGIENHGATCYLNSLLQTLFHVREFRRIAFHFVNKITIEDTEEEITAKATKSVAIQLAKVFVDLQNESSQPVNTTHLTEAFGWSKVSLFEQHDVQELARLLIDNLDTKIQKFDCKQEGSSHQNGKTKKSVLQKLLMGTMRKCVDCISGVRASSKEEPFYDLQLRVRGFSKLQDSLLAELQPEKLTGDNKYRYTNEETGEETLEDATLYSSFVELPPVLMMHLRRFEYCREKKDYIKVNDRFEYPTMLDVAPLMAKPEDKDQQCDEKIMYRLHSVLVHGGYASGGHYSVYTNPGEGSQWYKFNDARVFASHEAEATTDNFGGGHHPSRFWVNYTHSTTNAYMLVYIKESQWADLCMGASPPPKCLTKYIPTKDCYHLCIYTDEHVRDHVSSEEGQIDLLPDPDKGYKLEISSSITWLELARKIVTLIDADCDASSLRFWTTTHWHRHTRRGFGKPDLCISDFGIFINQKFHRITPKGRLPRLPLSSAASPIPFYISLHKRAAVTDRIIYVKRYHPHDRSKTGHLSYMGTTSCNNRGSIKELLNQIRRDFSPGHNGSEIRAWAERGAAQNEPNTPPDIAELLDLKARCDAKDGTIVIIQDVLPGKNKSHYCEIGSKEQPSEQDIHDAEQVLGTLGLDASNVASNLHAVEDSSQSINEACCVLLHPKVQERFSMLDDSCPLENHFYGFLNKIVVAFVRASQMQSQQTSSVMLEAESTLTHAEVVRKLAPQLKWWPSRIRLWTAKDGKKSIQWKADQSRTLGQVIKVLKGSRYSSAAVGEEQPISTLLYELLDADDITQTGDVELTVKVFNKTGTLLDTLVTTVTENATTEHLMRKIGSNRLMFVDKLQVIKVFELNSTHTPLSKILTGTREVQSFEDVTNPVSDSDVPLPLLLPAVHVKCGTGRSLNFIQNPFFCSIPPHESASDILSSLALPVGTELAVLSSDKMPYIEVQFTSSQLPYDILSDIRNPVIAVVHSCRVTQTAMKIHN